MSPWMKNLWGLFLDFVFLLSWIQPGLKKKEYTTYISFKEKKQ